MSIKLRKQDSALVSTPNPTHVQFFVDVDGAAKLKDSDGNIVPIGGDAAAEALATTGVNVNVGNAAPPTAGQVLTATSATAATWQDPTGGSGTASALETTGADVVVSGAAQPSIGQVLTATSSTAAAWQNPSSLPTGVAGGDLGGTYPNPNVNFLNTTGPSVNVALADPPNSGQVLTATSSTTAEWLDPTGDGVAEELATTGANVVIGSADPPTTGQVLTATSATSAEWQDPTGGGGTADALATTGADVVVDGAAPPTTGQILTATSATTAAWLNPVPGDPLSEYWASPASPHANDQEMLTDPDADGWQLFTLGVDHGITILGNIVQRSFTAGTPDIYSTSPLVSPQTRKVVNPNSRRSWMVLESFEENRVWFYGYQTTLPTAGNFKHWRSRISKATAPNFYQNPWEGMVQFVVVTDNAGKPDFTATGTALRIGWEQNNSSLSVHTDFYKAAGDSGGTHNIINTSVGLIENNNLFQPGAETEFIHLVLGSGSSATWWSYVRTAGLTIPLAHTGTGTAMNGGTVWVGLLWNARKRQLVCCDYVRQQDDSLIYL